MKKLKAFLVHKLIGNYYTEKEVAVLLGKIQDDMAQNVLIKSPEYKKTIIPFEYMMLYGKYKDTNPYKL